MDDRYDCLSCLPCALAEEVLCYCINRQDWSARNVAKRQMCGSQNLSMCNLAHDMQIAAEEEARLATMTPEERKKYKQRQKKV